MCQSPEASNSPPSGTAAQVLVDSQCALGEGIQWNSRDGRVYWTDIFGNALLSCDEYGRGFKRLPLEAGLCAFAFTLHQRLLAAFVDGLYWLDCESGSRDLIQAYQPDLPRTRMNDGGLDRQGRFLVGGIDEDGMTGITPVWRVDETGITEVIDGIGCANSICFSPDGGTMYFADTAGPEIFAYDYDTAAGTPSNRRVFARMAKAFGMPDGSCVDAAGGLWNARFGGGCVQRFAPDGREDQRVTLSVPNVTCCCIGGRDMNRLFITTARLAMTPAELETHPEAGGLFAIDLDVTGLEHGQFKGKRIFK